MESKLRQISVADKRVWWRWSSAQAMGAAIVILGLAAMLVALICSVSSSRANNARCLQAFANDEHRTLEAFFQDPALQDSLAHAIDHCSR
jgi:heme/copper-type cytochrome/quinol oxidase subunit 1